MTTTTDQRPRLTPAQRRTLTLMRVGAFYSAAELHTTGSVLKGLGDLGLVKPATTRGKGTIVGRLTAAGERERADLRLDELLATYALEGPEGLVLGDVVALWEAGRLERGDVDHALELRARAAGRERRRSIAEAAIIEELDAAGGRLTMLELRRRVEENSGRRGPLAAGDVTAAVDRLRERQHITRGRKLVDAGVGTYTVELRKGLRTIEPKGDQ